MVPSQPQCYRNLVLAQFKLANSAEDAAEKICVVAIRSISTAKTYKNWHANFGNNIQIIEECLWSAIETILVLNNKMLSCKLHTSSIGLNH